MRDRQRSVVPSVVAALAVCSLWRCAACADVPVIGVMTLPHSEEDPSLGSYFFDTYAEWLEGACARVVPVLYDSPPHVLDDLLRRVNGILFTGGSLKLTPGTAYFDAAQRVWDTALRLNFAGDHFPVWGTCLGFELMCILGSGGDQSVLVRYGFNSSMVSWPLEFTRDAGGSRMFGTECPREVVEGLASENITQNNHHDGVEPDTFYETKRLVETFVPLSTNLDLNGRRFVSSMEGRKVPFYGVQFHPEMNIYGWDPASGANHSELAIQASRWLVTRFLRDARSNTHTFGTEQELLKSVVQNFPRRWMPAKSHFSYLFPPYPPKEEKHSEL